MNVWHLPIEGSAPCLRSSSSIGTSRLAAAMQMGDTECAFNRLTGRESVNAFLVTEDALLLPLLLLLFNRYATSSIDPPSTAQ